MKVMPISTATDATLLGRRLSTISPHSAQMTPVMMYSHHHLRIDASNLSIVNIPTP